MIYIPEIIIQIKEFEIGIEEMITQDEVIIEIIEQKNEIL
jgi:hypothetical protein